MVQPTLLIKRLNSVSFKNTMTVIVGSSKESFMVYTDVICARSSFFKSACERWKKNGEAIKLLDVEPRLFDSYLQCVYRNEPPEVGYSGSLEHFVDVYILADRLGDLQSANIAIDKLIGISDEAGTVPSAILVSRAWEGTPPNSPLRRLLIDYIVHELSLHAFESYADQVAPEILCAIAKEFGRLKGNGQNDNCKVGEVFRKVVSKMPQCHYHQHDESCRRCDSTADRKAVCKDAAA